MFEDTITRLRLKTKTEIAAPIVICAEGHSRLINEQMLNISSSISAILIEPTPKNTAAVGAVAAAYINEIDPDGIILLLPSDHYIANIPKFWDAINRGAVIAAKGYLTTLGIQPSRPETGFGYIKCGEPLGDHLFSIDTFTEKPNSELAEKYLTGGGYFWNAGIFLFKAKSMLEEFRLYADDILVSCVAALKNATYERKEIFLNGEEFSKCKEESLDCAIMEKTKRAAIIAPVNIGWNDIGAWSSLYEVLAEKHNVSVVEIGDVISIDCKKSLLRSDGPLVAAIGIEDLVVVATGDAILVTKLSHSQDVKKIVERLKVEDRENLL